MKFVPKGPINNIPALVQIMAWRRPGDKPLSEPMMVSLPTYICVTRPQWVLTHPPTPTPGQNGQHLAHDVFKCILLNENVCILNKNSLKFLPKILIDKLPALVQTMACPPVSATSHYLKQWWSMLPTHTSVTRPQRVDTVRRRKRLHGILQTTFQMYFFLSELLYFDSNFTETCFLWPN